MACAMLAFAGRSNARLLAAESPGNTTLNWRLTKSDQLAIQNQWKVQS